MTPTHLSDDQLDGFGQAVFGACANEAARIGLTHQYSGYDSNDNLGEVVLLDARSSEAVGTVLFTVVDEDDKDDFMQGYGRTSGGQNRASGASQPRKKRSHHKKRDRDDERDND